MRLIDADALKNHYAWWEGGTKENTLDEQKKIFDTIVNLQPTIDPAENGGCWGCCCEKLGQVKHGKWELMDEAEPRRYGCSECKRLSYTQNNYCSYCGARMDG